MRRRRRKKEERDFLVRVIEYLHRQEGLTPTSIARVLNVPHSLVYYYLKKEGNGVLKLRFQRLSRTEIERYRRLVEQKFGYKTTS